LLRTPGRGREIWRKKCGEQDTSTAGGKWRQQHRTELKPEKRLSVMACAPPTASDKAQVK